MNKKEELNADEWKLHTNAENCDSNLARGTLKNPLIRYVWGSENEKGSILFLNYPYGSISKIESLDKVMTLQSSSCSPLIVEIRGYRFIGDLNGEWNHINYYSDIVLHDNEISNWFLHMRNLQQQNFDMLNVALITEWTPTSLGQLLYAPNGNLSHGEYEIKEELREINGNRGIIRILGLMSDFIDGIQLLHQHGIVLRDFNSRNLWIRDDLHGAVAVFDCGKQERDPHLPSSGAVLPRTGYAVPQGMEQDDSNLFHEDIYKVLLLIDEAVSMHKSALGEECLKKLMELKNNCLSSSNSEQRPALEEIKNAVVQALNHCKHSSGDENMKYEV